MIYRSFQGLNLSCLGMGAMRLPKTGEGEKIDEAKAREIIEYAYEQGINYFDTAYRYHGGESETFVGRVLQQYPRESFYLATKFPGHMMECRDGHLGFTSLLASHPPVASPADVFEKQLEKCAVDYFDFYLLHNLCETAYDFYTDEQAGVVEYLVDQKKKGRIRHLGFSAHGRSDTIDSFLNHYHCFEFVQIQLNYLDWTLQNAGRKYELITKHGLPVVVMEPCRGGRLAFLNDDLTAMLKKARPHDSVASWAFRFLQSLPNVQVVLSGMTTMDQLKENIETFSKNDPVKGDEKELLDRVVKALVDMVPCTLCRYCCEGCPKELDIPHLITLYNELKFGNPQYSLNETLRTMQEPARPSACIGCGACAKVCPQSIAIPAVLRDFAGMLKS
ncbi:Fe-S oxidoreductase [Spirochaetia bacterium]|nr:Fe-S oxidoreductase [Spirochaetia bacterium]